MSLLITNAGIEASIQAGHLGIEYKITHISIGTEGYIPNKDQTELRNEVQRKAITRSELVAPGQLHFETVWEGDESFEGKELGYWLEEGTLFAVDSRDGDVITFKHKDTVVTEACELNLAASPIKNITVELQGAPYATEQVAGIAKIATNTLVDEGVEDRSFLTVKKLVYALGVQHVVDKLVSHLWLALAAKIFPVGSAIPWFKDEAPEGFAVMKNQAFDMTVYTELAKIWPNGVIPDMRGCGVIGKEEGETIGAFEEGQVKSHGHPNSTISSMDLGSKISSYTGRHQHDNSLYQPGQTGQGWFFGGATNTTQLGTTQNVSTGDHSHTTDLGSHVHEVMIALYGAVKNTINHRKVNWIVRMA